MPKKEPVRSLQIEGFVCSRCGKQKFRDLNSLGTGYGTNEAGEKVCYECCAEVDREEMRTTGKIMLYLTEGKSTRYENCTMAEWYVTNWPGTLKLRAGVQKSWHNFAGRDGRRDVWFHFEGEQWHGVNIGWGQVVRARRTKEKLGYVWTPPPPMIMQPVARRLDLGAVA